MGCRDVWVLKDLMVEHFRKVKVGFYVFVVFSFLFLLNKKMTKIDLFPVKSQFFETFWLKNQSENASVRWYIDSNELSISVCYHVGKCNAF